MKKTILFLVAGLFAISAGAQTLKESEVNPHIKNTFKKMYPTATVEKWEKEGNNYEAEFHAGKTETCVTLGPNGQLIETEVAISTTELPKAVNTYVTSTLGGKKIKEASKITDASNKVSYEAEVDGVDYIFDENGGFLKKETDTDTDTDKK
jgi:hypothetical protein